MLVDFAEQHEDVLIDDAASLYPIGGYDDDRILSTHSLAMRSLTVWVAPTSSAEQGSSMRITHSLSGSSLVMQRY